MHAIYRGLIASSLAFLTSYPLLAYVGFFLDTFGLWYGGVFFFDEWAFIYFGEKFHPIEVGLIGVLVKMAIEVDQLQKLKFELIQNFKIDSSDCRIKGVFIVHIIEVFDSH